MHGRGGVAVRAPVSCAESLRLESDSRFLPTARINFTQQQMATWWHHWGDKGGKERNWPPYLTCRWLRKSFLFNRHFPTYRSIRDYLYVFIRSGQLVMEKNYTNLSKRWAIKSAGEVLTKVS